MKTWKTLSRKSVLKPNRFLEVELHRLELPDGRVIADWPWVITPEYVNVVVETPGRRYWFFRQTKYAVGATLAPVGGYIEPGEMPLAAAQRELREEMGFAADEWVDLGHFVVDSNRGAGRGHFYLARGARRVCECTTEELEEQEPVELSREDMGRALDEGQFKVMPWAALVGLALRRLEAEHG